MSRMSRTSAVGSYASKIDISARDPIQFHSNKTKWNGTEFNWKRQKSIVFLLIRERDSKLAPVSLPQMQSDFGSVSEMDAIVCWRP